MRLVQWTDSRGYVRQSFIKDDDPDDMAKKGIRHEPPDLTQIDWDDVQRDLHNELVKRGLISWRDVQVQQSTLGPAIEAVLKRRLIALYREKV
jgi:hypothetical protein